MESLFAGIDLGTSGCRIIVINKNKEIRESNAINYIQSDEQNPELWVESVFYLLSSLPDSIKSDLKALAIDGTSGTILLTDKTGQPSSSALMYYDQRASKEAQLIKNIMPQENGGQGASSSLARLMWLLKNEPSQKHKHALHQADYILGKLTGNYAISDENNSLKLGYDVVNRCWKVQEMRQLGVSSSLLPNVYKAGTCAGYISKDIAKKLGLPETLQLSTGTTDSIAAFIATGANKLGEAVTSLGSTLVIKLIANQALFSPDHGIYSHRLGDKWLVGGASNSGGKVLRHFFTDAEMIRMTASLDPFHSTELHYYPLIDVGERFPIADINKRANLTPRPDNDIIFFQGMLEGIAEIEQKAYEKLFELGAPKLLSVRSVGGGAKNLSWVDIRQGYLNVKMIQTEQSEAAYGSALLALSSINQKKHELRDIM